jgi:cytochrome P450
VYALSEHPDVAARLRAELDAQLGTRPAVMADLPKLKYLDAVMRETLRLYPPAWLIGREIVQPFEIGGYTLQPGESIMMSPYTVQRDGRFFPEPDRFMPERWLEPPATPLPKFAYFPFGGGPRVCIGNHFAMMEIALVLATLLQQVELTVVPGFELKFSPVVTLRPAQGVPVLVRRRGVAPPARKSPWTLRAPSAGA